MWQCPKCCESHGDQFRAAGISPFKLFLWPAYDAGQLKIEL